MFYSIAVLTLGYLMTLMVGDVPSLKALIVCTFACGAVLAFIEYRTAKREVAELEALGIEIDYQPHLIHRTCDLSVTKE